MSEIPDIQPTFLIRLRGELEATTASGGSQEPEASWLAALADLTEALIEEWSRSDDGFDTVGAKLYVTQDMIAALERLEEL